MSQKRHQCEEGTSFDDKRLRKSHSFRSVALEVISLIRMQNLMTPVLEPLIRRVVKEEVDTALRKYIIGVKRNSVKDACLPEPRSLQLQFVNSISLPVFSGSRIEAEGCASIEVALVDVQTGQVACGGPMSVAKLEIVVLEGDFDGDKGDNWTLEEFTGNIVREREGKKPLLTGDVFLTLKDGMGSVGDISFTDNSSWTRSRKFRLGARLLGDIGGVRVREAMSEAFIVRDHRGESYKKHHPPSLSDEVWRLEKIGKDGAFHKRLSRERINTVQDFLIILSLDPTRLRNILGTGMSAKKWEVTVEHARTCVLDKTLYLYNPSTSQQNAGIIFNVVGQVAGILSDGQYVAIDKLSDDEKESARKLVNSAFRDRERIVTVDESFLDIPTLSNAPPPSNLLSEGSYHQDSTSHSQQASSPGFMHSLYSVGDSNSPDLYFPGVDPMDITFDPPPSFPSICDTESMARAFSANEHFKYVEAGCSFLSPDLDLSADLHNGFIPCLDHTDKAPKWWNVLVWVLRWRSSIKRIVRESRLSPIY